MHAEFLFAQSMESAMVSTLKRMLVGEARSEEESTNVYDRDSDPEGMTSGEESELDHFHANESCFGVVLFQF